MPSKSKAQHNLMEAAAHTKGGYGGVPQKVGKEFVNADKGKTFKSGGLYENIHRKQQRIAEGSGESMRKPGSKGAPTAQAFIESAKTAKKAEGGDVEKDYYRSNEGAPFLIVNHRTGQVVGKANTIKGARRSLEKRDLDYGGYAHSIKDSTGKSRYSNGGVSLAVGKGEKLPTSKGAGLTEKGREKYNRETGSHLKAPQPQGGSRKDSFCARMAGVVEHSKGDAPRAKASLKRWKCPGW
jgi:hypothetical protein